MGFYGFCNGQVGVAVGAILELDDSGALRASAVLVHGMQTPIDAFK